MKNTKNQAPKTKETPRSKIQGAPVVYGRAGSKGDSGDMEGWILREEAGEPKPDLHPFDLEERTAKFGEQIVRFIKRIPKGVDFPENNRLIDQLVGAATSLGANYREANDSVSRKDFKFTINRCLKESKETQFFLRMVAASEPSLAEDARTLWREANELTRIFASMYRK